ncbi:glycoside hydrolase family 31 protein [Cytobacillus sp. IB215665]|uniref:glycoside hydrolase family 31 protein n=1 Tax=Cytobacillus sp. IB215665 TaxID=3097357 RepID=UPI002A1033BF|nr:glycoside hydrolase family 31 protein [Cytobacillus sp. IB215665]MDX8365343.1 glycoside hydrolase family 31 protein [Cytobacillus sp. IB215665]
MLDDSSFAIHPGQNGKHAKVSYRDISSIVRMSKEGNVYSYFCEAGSVALQFVREDIVRIVMNVDNNLSMKSSVAIVKKPEEVEVKTEETEGCFILSTNTLKVEISKSPLRINIFDTQGELIVGEGARGLGLNEKGDVICHKMMSEHDHFYGFGEKTGFLDKRGEKMTMWNSDVYAPHNPETNALYQSIPYFMTLRDGKAHGLFFDSTWETTFDLQSKEDSYTFSAAGGQIDYYVMAGPTPKDVLYQYSELTGRMPLPPKWALGYHQSRYSYESEQEVRHIAKTFSDKKIPVDVIYLDIHYMDEYRVFTFNKLQFPTPEKMIQDLKEVGIRLVPIVDPGVKEDAEYEIYQEGIREDYFCKYIEGNIYFGEVWPGNSAFPDFTSRSVRKWWGAKHSYYSDIGIEGIWNDMNEPAVFNETKTMDVKVMHDNDNDPRTHRELHNIYGFMMGKATYEGMKDHLNGKRPFLLTRAGYAGIQRYAAVWTGDNRSFWEHLQMSLPMCMNLGLSGVAFTGPDVGGFAHDSNGELLTRWTQVGAFTPYFRNHSAIGTVRQEPWSFGEKYEKIIKKYIELRYQWLPQIYSLFEEASRTGIPVMRPLLMEYPEDENTYNLSDQFMIGDNVIVAPILQPTTQHRVIYLPKGNWVNYWTDELVVGGKHQLIEADLETLPIFIKQGTMIAHGDIKKSTDIVDVNRTLHLYVGDTNTTYTYSLYEDDGSTFAYKEGKYLYKTFTVHCYSNKVEISVKDDGQYIPDWQELIVVVHGANSQLQLMVNGEIAKNKSYDNISKKMLFSI